MLLLLSSVTLSSAGQKLHPVFMCFRGKSGKLFARSGWIGFHGELSHS